MPHTEDGRFNVGATSRPHSRASSGPRSRWRSEQELHRNRQGHSTGADPTGQQISMECLHDLDTSPPVRFHPTRLTLNAHGQHPPLPLQALPYSLSIPTSDTLDDHKKHAEECKARTSDIKEFQSTGAPPCRRVDIRFCDEQKVRGSKRHLWFPKQKGPHATD